ncbi:UNVERIFIED_CONTAM: hypothetical protein Sradi_1780800 [Sesamum radiatum]|uniref:DUF4283 domain-containing protein n=1 Tax=Sesamum radiatum TaxID=300843 RepID=A0AAW2TV83_SESRA
MRVFKWSPTFNPDHESSIVPIWVNFPGLPAHLYRKDALFTIASMVGTPLQVADSTYNRSKLSRASVCIEIDLLKPCLEEVNIQIQGQTFVQKIEYEQTPRFCSLCKHVGHQNSECYSKGGAPKPPRRTAGENSQQRTAATQQARKVPDELPVRNESLIEKGDCSPSHLYTNTSIAEHVRTEEECDNHDIEILVPIEKLDVGNGKIETVNNDSCDSVGAMIPAVVVDVRVSVDDDNDDHAVDHIVEINDDECDTVFVKMRGDEIIEDVDDGQKDDSGALILRQNNILCNFERTSWGMIDGALRILETVYQFGKVMKVIEDDVETVIKRNKLVIKTAALYQRCVLIFDRVSKLYLRPLDERSPPIATRTRRRKKGKNSLEPPDFHYF